MSRTKTPRRRSDHVSRWPYYANKLYQEETARRACGDRVELVTLNPSLLLGPGDDRLSSTRPILQSSPATSHSCRPVASTSSTPAMWRR